jgi:hypothetical protein
MRKYVEIHDLKPSDVTVERFTFRGRPAVAIALGDEVRIHGATDELLAAFWKVTESLDPVSPAEGSQPADLPTMPVDMKARTIFDVEDETELTESEAVAKWNDAEPAEVATEPVELGNLPEDGETIMVPNTFELGEVPRYEPPPEPEPVPADHWPTGEPGPNATILDGPFDTTVQLPEGVEIEMNPVDWDAPHPWSQLTPGQRGEIHYRGETWPIQVGDVVESGPETSLIRFTTDRIDPEAAVRYVAERYPVPPPPPREGDPQWMRDYQAESHGRPPVPPPPPLSPTRSMLTELTDDVDRWDPGL